MVSLEYARPIAAAHISNTGGAHYFLLDGWTIYLEELVKLE